MKRKLISYDVFENIQAESLSTAEQELMEAESILARTLQCEDLTLVCFGSDNVLYETADGEYVHATYKLNKKDVQFENIEQLAIEEESEINHSKEVLGTILDALLDDNEDKANELFNSFIELPVFKRDLTEGFQVVATASTGHGRHSKFRGRTRPGGHAAAMKAARTRKKNARKISPSMKKILDRKRAIVSKKLGGRDQQTGKGKRAIRTYLRFKTAGSGTKAMKEWNNICENVFAYVDYASFGPMINESIISADEKGNVIAVRVPNTTARNEAKMLQFNWKTLDTDVKVLRGGAKKLAENNEFCKAISDLKRQNAVSVKAQVQESLEDIVSRWSQVLYLTETELSVIIAEALQTVGATNYDDQTCDFMADAILRTAHNAYSDRVDKIMTLSGQKNDGIEMTYETFKDVADGYFSHIDESHTAEMQVYVDLYEALRSVYGLLDDKELKQETASHLSELAAIIEQEVSPSLEIAMAAASWLSDFVETNLDSEGWMVSNNVHTTINGDHPRMAQNAKKGYAPASDSTGDWGDEIPVSDGKNYKGGLADEMRNRSWGQEGGNDTWPNLNNPYIPKPYGDYKIKGEKSIENDDALGHEGGSDTWPSLQNPNVPKGETPQTYKMNHGREADLVVDK